MIVIYIFLIYIILKNYISNGISEDIDLAYDELLDVNVKVRKLFKRGSK